MYIYINKLACLKSCVSSCSRDVPEIWITFLNFNYLWIRFGLSKNYPQVCPLTGRIDACMNMIWSDKVSDVGNPAQVGVFRGVLTGC